MTFPTTLVVGMIISVVSVGSTLASVAKLMPWSNLVIVGTLYCINVDGSVTAIPSGTTIDILNSDLNQVIDVVREEVNEGLFALAVSVAAVGGGINAQLEVQLPFNTCNYDPPARALRYPILAVKLDGVTVGYVPGLPTPIRA